jgi:DNA-binding GntR family transcriptional regulator
VVSVGPKSPRPFSFTVTEAGVIWQIASSPRPDSSCKMPHVPDFIVKLPKVPNLTDRAYLSLKQHMLDGSLVEGARLTEAVLARQLGISKSPVREALNRRDLFDVRVLLEVHSVRTARVTPELLRELEESIRRTQEYLERGDKLAHAEEDLRFHSMIAASSANREFFRIFEGIQHKTILSRSKTYHLSPNSAPISHQKIYEALRRGDRDEAERAMSHHILFLRDSLIAFIRERGEGTMPKDESLSLITG